MEFFKIEISSELESMVDIPIVVYQDDSIGRISIFFSLFESIEELTEGWEELSNVIASVYQSKLTKKEDEFEKWNIYIIYILKAEITKELKFKIENDKFSNRKIVYSNPDGNLEDDMVKKLIIMHISNEDLVITKSLPHKTEQATSNYLPKTSLWNLIKDSDLLHYKKDKQEELIDKIIQKIVDEN